MAPDMSFIKQDLRESVTKVAGRLSNMANNVMSTFQVKTRFGSWTRFSLYILYSFFIKDH